MSNHNRGLLIGQLTESSNLLGCLHQLLVRYLNDVRPENELDEITRNAFEGKEGIKKRLDILKINLNGLTPYQKGIAYGANFSNHNILSKPVDLQTFHYAAKDLFSSKFTLINPALSTLDTHIAVNRDLILPSVCIPVSLDFNASNSRIKIPNPPYPGPSLLYEIMFSGIYCYQQTTNEPVTEGASDEPYVVWSGLDAVTGATWQTVSEEFSSVTTGSPHSPSGMNPKVYGPAPDSHSGLVLATLCESDQVSNTDEIQQVIQTFMGWMRTLAAATWVTPSGTISGLSFVYAFYWWLKRNKVIDWFFNLIGDDIIGTNVFLVWPNSLASLSTSSTWDHEGISYHFWLKHISPSSEYYTFYTVGSTF